MVRNYIRKSTRQSWDETNMQQAVLSVLNGDHGYRKASEMYGVPKGAIERRVAKLKKNPGAVDEVCKKSLGSIATVFTKEEEEELVSYVQQMEKMLFGLSSYELRKLAYELAERNGKANKFNDEKGVAGYDWYRGFMARHSDKLSLRKPEATSAARAMGFNRVAVTSFFDLLEDVVDKYKLSGDRIWNCDEIGVSTVPKSLSKVVATKGKRQIGSVTSAERGQLVTSVICCSAAGQYMPPMLIFPRVRMKPELMDGAPPGAWAECHPSGWIQTELFIKYIRQFIQFTRASKEKPVLLILDGHAAHTKSVELIDIAREHGVILLCLPPHCTHRLQPLDLAFMKPLSTFYDHQVRIWLRNHPGRVVTQFQISNLFGRAYLQAATMLNAINGFKASGIWPLDRSVFSEADFIAAEATDIPVAADDLNLQTTTSASSHPTASTSSYSTTSASRPPTASTSSTSAACTSRPAASASSYSTTSAYRPPTASKSSTTAASTSRSPAASTSSYPTTSVSSHLIASASRPPTSSTSRPSPTSTSRFPTASASTSKPPAASTSRPLISSTSTDSRRPTASTFINATTSVSTPTTSPQKQDETAFGISPQAIIPFPKANITKRVSRQRGKTAILTSSPYKKSLLEKKEKIISTKTLTKGKGKGVSSSGKPISSSQSQCQEQDAQCLYCDELYSESAESWVACQGDCNRWAHYSCAGLDERNKAPVFICELCDD